MVYKNKKNDACVFFSIEVQILAMFRKLCVDI